MDANHLFVALHHDLHHDLDHDHDAMSPSRWGTLRHSVHGVAALKAAAAAGNRRRTVWKAVVIIVCGCLSVVPCELILKRDSRGMDMVTLFNYLFAIASSLLSQGMSVLAERKLPLPYTGALVLATFGFNQLCNVAFGMGIAMPVALVVKNGGLLCQMLSGAVVTHEVYSLQQMASAIVITFGILVTVLANAGQKPSVSAGDDASVSLLATVVPAAILLGAMMCRALGSSVSQLAFREHGKRYHEVLFYQHALGLPLLLWHWRGLSAQAWAWSTGVTMNVFGFAVPMLWMYLASQVVLNYVVTKSCTELVGCSSSVVLNLVLTMQRFVSIVVSATIFNAPPYPPLLMWFGAAFVIAGCVGYVLAPKAQAAPKQA